MVWFNSWKPCHPGRAASGQGEGGEAGREGGRPGPGHGEGGEAGGPDRSGKSPITSVMCLFCDSIQSFISTTQRIYIFSQK